jgi:beta-phosphoglucomutase-like phosphatase (HAD superfamily)
MDISAIIFDLDGTLADTMPAHFASWQIICQRYGLLFPEERFYALGGWPTRRILELLASEQGVVLDSEAVSLEKERTFLEMVHKVKRINEVAEVAIANRGKLPMAVATGSRRRQAELC